MKCIYFLRSIRRNSASSTLKINVHVSNINFKLILACGKGSYGVDCHETCGHCRDVNKCSSINGTCLTGCDAGYEGDMCKASEYKRYVDICIAVFLSDR